VQHTAPHTIVVHLCLHKNGINLSSEKPASCLSWCLYSL